MKKRSKNSGFMLIELVVVLVIISILATIGIPIYRKYTRRAYVSEALGVIGIVVTAEKTYNVVHNTYYPTGGAVDNDLVLDVDARTNTYFRTFDVQVQNGGQTFSIITTGINMAAGITVTYISDPDNNGLVDTTSDIQINGI